MRAAVCELKFPAVQIPEMVLKYRQEINKKQGGHFPMAVNRYVGEYPVIGIRPTIDGRRGVLKVRESLEEQTMNMAKSAAKLLRKTCAIPTASR
jgi:L-fucose isomerase (EC 5.3.1.25)